MGYVVLVSLKESMSELGVDEIMAQIMSLEGVETVSPEWRSDRKKKKMGGGEKRVGKQSRENSVELEKERRKQKNQYDLDDSYDFDSKLFHVFHGDLQRGRTPPTRMDVDDPLTIDTDTDETDLPNEGGAIGIQVHVKTHSPLAASTPMRGRKRKGTSPKSGQHSPLSVQGDKENEEKERGGEMTMTEKGPKAKISMEKVNCQMCHRLVQSSQLRWHSATHMPDKQYKCGQCDFTGSIPQVMRNHLTKAHNYMEYGGEKGYVDRLDDSMKEKWIDISAECFPTYAEVTRGHILANRRRERKTLTYSGDGDMQE